MKIAFKVALTISITLGFWTSSTTFGQSVSSIAYSELIQLNQGWSREEADLYNHTTEGTNLAPLDFFLSLPDPDKPTDRFLPRLTTKYGFIDAPKSEANPSGLPIGIAVDERPKSFGDRPYIGMTCSACHTRQVAYRSLDGSGNEKVWNLSIHGGPALVDIHRFKSDLYSTFLKLNNDEGLFKQFATNLLSRDPSQEDAASIKQELAEFLGPVVTMRGIIKAAGVELTEPGPGNLNALTQGYYNNLGLFGWLVKKGLVPPNPTPSQMPMPPFEGADNFPPVWFAWSDNWAQWFVEIHHPGPRNWIQAISSSEVRPPKMIESLKQASVFATIHFENISAIQSAIERLRTPKWPEKIFGALDATKMSEGRQLYVKYCASCHEHQPLPPNEYGIVIHERQAFDVGTDPTAYAQFAKDGAVRATSLKDVSEKIIQMRTAQLVGALGEPAAKNHLAMASRGRPNDFRMAQSKNLQIPGPRWQESGAAYWAPPLQGIFATSPYFHNGSVRTLSDVLKPATERETTFRSGSNEFLPGELGLKSEGVYTFNTKEVGKGNHGHEFGADLSKEEKLSLIEYLKSL
jgi:hypothetical protein